MAEPTWEMVDTLRGELREEKEYAEALDESKRSAEAILSKKIMELSALQQQLEELLGAVDTHKGKWDGEHDTRPVRNELLAAVWEDDAALYSVASKIRADIEEGK